MKIRADLLAVKQELFSSREQAQRYIMAGLVHSENDLIDKPGQMLSDTTKLFVKKILIPYVSRGGVKLEKALTIFDINVNAKIVLDIGSSTGGFVDCALQKGAALVYSVDVTNHLDNKLRQDQRVIVIEKTNFRYLQPHSLMRGNPEIVTIDVSFISLKHIFANLKNLISKDCEIIALIKPQFEAEKGQVGKKGVIRDYQLLPQIIANVIGYGESDGFAPINLTYSPIRGKKEGNIEFLCHFRYLSVKKDIDIEKIVVEAYNYFKEKGKDQC